MLDLFGRGVVVVVVEPGEGIDAHYVATFEKGVEYGVVDGSFEVAEFRPRYRTRPRAIEIQEIQSAAVGPAVHKLPGLPLALPGLSIMFHGTSSICR